MIGEGAWEGGGNVIKLYLVGILGPSWWSGGQFACLKLGTSI